MDSKKRHRGPRGQFIRRPPGFSSWATSGELAIIILAAIVYTAILLTPLWVDWFRGS